VDNWHQHLTCHAAACWCCRLQGLQYDRHLTRPWDLFETGVSTDTHTMRCAWAMVVTSGLYMVVQVSRLPRGCLGMRVVVGWKGADSVVKCVAVCTPVLP
jgi:hypothetical protein